MTVKIFCCYAHEDEDFLEKLKKHLISLERQGIIELWHDRDIEAGAEWEKEIDKHLNEAEIILLLISTNFMASDYCYSNEMQQAIRRHEQGKVKVIPIILRPVYWANAPFSKLQALPSFAKPISTWPDNDEAFVNVTEGIRRAVEKLLEQKTPHPLRTLHAQNQAFTPSSTNSASNTSAIDQQQLFERHLPNRGLFVIIALLFLATIVLGVYVIATKDNIVIPILSFTLALLAFLFGVLQIVPHLLPQVSQTPKTRLTFVGIVLLIVSLLIDVNVVIPLPQVTSFINRQPTSPSLSRSTITPSPTGTSSSVPTLVQKKYQNQHANLVTATFPSRVTANNLIIVAVTQFIGTVSKVIDNLGNPYSQVTGAQHANSSTDYVELYYAKNVKEGAITVTVTFTSRGDKNVAIYEYSGIDVASPLDQVVTHKGFGDTPNGGTFNTRMDNELYFVVGLDDNGNHSTPTAGSGYTLVDHQDDSASHERFYSEYRVALHGNYQTNFSIAVQSHWDVIGTSFKPVPSPYGGTLIINDTLKDNSQGYGWDETGGHCFFTGGAYHIATSNPNNYECNTEASLTDLSNFAYQVTMKIDKGNQAGICFRFTVHEQTGYCFFFNLTGHYILERAYFNIPREEELVTGQSSYFLTGLGKTNQIAVRVRGNNLDIFINGHFIRSAEDSTFSHGQIGVFLVYPGSYTEAEFSNIMVWTF